MLNKRIALTIALALGVLASACGGPTQEQVSTADGSAFAARVEPVPAPAPATGTVGDITDPAPLTSTVRDVGDAFTELPKELTALEGIDLQKVWHRGCLLWSYTRSRDHAAINDPVMSFLGSTNDPSIYDNATIDTRDNDEGIELVRTACRLDDPNDGWVTLSAGLGLDDAEFTRLVRASCASWQPARSERDGFHEFTLEVIGVSDPTDLIDQLCT